LVGVPHIWHAREFLRSEFLGGRLDWGLPVTAAIVRNLSSIVICNSNTLRDQLASLLDPSRLDVVYNGFELPLPPFPSAEAKFDRAVASRNPIDLLVAAYLLPGKGHEEAVQALAVLRHRGIDVRLNFAGSGPGRYEARLHTMASELGVESSVRFLGFVDNIATLLAQSAVTIVASRVETFGRVAVESLASWTPVVGADAGSTSEILDNGRFGLLYPPGDAVALADQVGMLLSDREAYCTLSASGRQSVLRRFGPSPYIEGVEAAIIRTVKARASAE
jgi:glycosyltransferase involved in cell wall biosynthesis